MDWNQPYSCEGWATEFQQTLPILDDGSGSNIYGLFGIGYVPHSVVIGGDGQVIYSQSGFNYNTMISIIEYGLSSLVLDMDEDGVMDDVDNCMEDYNPNQADTDSDGVGDLCDACNNLIFTDGDINGDLVITILDILGMVDIILGEVESQCGYEASDMNLDGHVNILDVIRVVQIIIGGNQRQAIVFLESVLDKSTFNRLLPRLSVYPNPSNGNVFIEGNGRLKIYDMTGKLILMPYVNNNYTWETDELSSGIYFIISEISKIKVTLLK